MLAETSPVKKECRLPAVLDLRTFWDLDRNCYLHTIQVEMVFNVIIEQAINAAITPLTSTISTTPESRKSNIIKKHWALDSQVVSARTPWEIIRGMLPGFLSCPSVWEVLRTVNAVLSVVPLMLPWNFLLVCLFLSTRQSGIGCMAILTIMMMIEGRR